MFDAELAELAQAVRSGATLRVFLALPVRLDFVAWRRVDQTELAHLLGMDQASVSRAMAELHRLGVLARKGKAPLVLWRFTTKTAWRGRAAAFQKAARSEPVATAVNERPAPIVAEVILWKAPCARNGGRRRRCTQLAAALRFRPIPSSASTSA